MVRFCFVPVVMVSAWEGGDRRGFGEKRVLVSYGFGLYGVVVVLGGDKSTSWPGFFSSGVMMLGGAQGMVWFGSGGYSCRDERWKVFGKSQSAGGRSDTDTCVLYSTECMYVVCHALCVSIRR